MMASGKKISKREKVKSEYKIIGTYIYGNNDVYKGDWKNNKKQGYGKLFINFRCAHFCSWGKL